MRQLLKSRKAGVVTSTVAGVGGLIILTIIVLVIISTIDDADLLSSGTTTAFTVTNESDGYINATGYTLESVGYGNSTFVITEITNATDDDGAVVSVGNYTNTFGVITNATGSNWASVNITYTLVNFVSSSANQSAVSMTGNFTDGLDKISAKIPTILLIVAVVFLFGALVLLMRQSQLMGIGGGSSL